MGKGAMAEFCGAFPVLLGKAGQVQDFAAACMTRRGEFAASLERAGVERELWFLSPDGTMLYVFLEADDVSAAFAQIATSSDPFDEWQRQQILEISGVDMTQPGPPPSEKILDIAT
jgi:L-rhamnose mutarotase